MLKTQMSQRLRLPRRGHRVPWAAALFLIPILVPGHARAFGAEAQKPKAAAAKAKAPKSIVVAGKTYFVLGDCDKPTYNFWLDLAPKTGAKDVKAARQALAKCSVVFGLRNAREHYRLGCSGGKVVLYRVTGGKASPLATRSRAEERAGKALAVEVRRRASLLTVILDGVACLEALDSTHASGRVGLYAPAPGVKVSRWRHQPVEPFRIEDDFMRVGKELGQWEAWRGEWRLHTARESQTHHPDTRRRMEPGRSANYFSFTGRSDDWGLAVPGDSHDFWDEYRFAASLKSDGRPAGLAFYVRDAGNFFLLRWHLLSRAIRAQPLEVVRVVNGKEQVVTRAAVPGAAGQWYRLEVYARGHRVKALVDGAEVMDVRIPGQTAGRVGLYVQGNAKTLFDDVAAASAADYAFDTPEGLARQGQAPKGWRLEKVPGSGLAGETTRCRLIPTVADAQPYWLGDPRWREYVATSRVRLPKLEAKPAGMVGIGSRRAGARQVICFRCGVAPGTRKPVAQVVLLENGKERVLAETPQALKPGGWHEFQLDLTDPGVVRGLVDGRLVVRARDPVPGPGQPGLYARGAVGASFRDARVAFAREEGVSKHVTQQLFAQDQYMAGWASAARAWVQEGQDKSIFWHKSDFFGKLALGLPPHPGTTVFLSAAGTSPRSAYALSLRQAGGRGLLVLSRQGKEMARAALDATGTLSVWREGPYLWVKQGEKEVLACHDPQPLAGTRVGLRPAGLSLAKVSVKQYQVEDYLFKRAPADWRKTGVWEVTNRFTCDPRWSWFSGTGWDGAAVIWNKFAYKGNLTLEFYAGMRMASGKYRSYPRPGEINATICGDGRDLPSGYSVIICGWDRLWTGMLSRIMRRNRQVAFTKRELVPSNRERSPTVRPITVPWDPGGRPIHGAWYYIKVRRVGPRVECYFDNQLIMQYEDPKPLAGDRVALWTQDNSIMVARVRISYDRKEIVRPTVKPLPVGTGRFSLRENLPVPQVHSSSHPGLYCDFERGTAATGLSPGPDSVWPGWETTDPEMGAELALDTAKPGSGKACLRLTNVNSGGSFGARVKVPGLDLTRVAAFRFKYRFDSSVRVNLYLTFNGRLHFIRFTGPTYSDEQIKCLGSIPDVRADGKWHQAAFDLASAVRALYPAESNLITNELRLGVWHEGYLWAGFGPNVAREGERDTPCANPEGATYYLDDFLIQSVGPGSFDFTCQEKVAGQAIDGYAYSLTPGKPADPGTAVTGTGHASHQGGQAVRFAKTSRSLGPGLWHLNLRAHTGTGQWTAPVHHAFVVDTAPLEIADFGSRISDSSGGESRIKNSTRNTPDWGGEPIRIRFKPFPGATLKLAEARVKVNGTDIAYSPRVFQYDNRTHALTLDLSGTDLTFADAEKVHFSLEAGKRVSAAGMPVERQAFNWTYTFARARDRIAPSAPRLFDRPMALDFEEGLGEVRSRNPQTVRVVRDPIGPASGRCSLQVLSTVLGGDLWASLAPAPFHAGRNPILAFDYRIHKVVHVDLFMITGVGTRSLGFTDNQRGQHQLLAVPGVIADGRWHRAEISLRKALEARDYAPAMYDISQIYTADGGYHHCAPGASFNLDNITVIPGVSAKQGISLAWHARDLAGIAAYSYRWTKQPEDVPDEKAEGPENSRTFSNVPEGRVYFHIRAQDRAGNWGPPAHYPFLVDNTPPRVICPTVSKAAPGLHAKMAACETLRLKVAETGESGVDRASFVQCKVGGTRVKRSALLSRYRFDTGDFEWDWMLDLGGARPAVPDGAVLPVALPPVSDFAGNKSTPLSFQMVVDHKADSLPPTAPDVRSATGELVWFDTFTRDLGQWRPYPSSDDSRVTRVQRTPANSAAVRADYCVQVEGPYGGAFGATIRSSGYDLKAHPHVRFDYKFPPGARLQLVATVNGVQYGVSLGSYSRRASARILRRRGRGRATRIAQAGIMRDIVADNSWHTASLNLHTTLAKVLPAQRNLKVGRLLIAGISAQNAAGTAFFVDNFAVYGRARVPPKLLVAAYDLTGIAGFSYLVDTNPSTTPPAKPGPPLKHTPDGWELPLPQPLSGAAGPASGTSYLHVRALDGAGNWGSAAHVPIGSAANPKAKAEAKSRARARARAAARKRAKKPRRASKAKAGR